MYRNPHPYRFISFTDLEYLLDSPIKVWAFGHTHLNCDYNFNDGPVRIVTNQLGYAGEKVKNYQPDKVIEVAYIQSVEATEDSSFNNNNSSNVNTATEGFDNETSSLIDRLLKQAPSQAKDGSDGLLGSKNEYFNAKLNTNINIKSNDNKNNNNNNNKNNNNNNSSINRNSNGNSTKKAVDHPEYSNEDELESFLKDTVSTTSSPTKKKEEEKPDTPSTATTDQQSKKKSKYSFKF